MNKLFWLGVLACAALPVAAESVSAVSFNPSRLGNYEYLKVSGSAKLPGGLKTPRLDVNSKGTVTIQSPGTTFVVNSITGAGSNLNFPNAVIYGSGTAPASYTPQATNLAAPSGVTPVPLAVTGGTLKFTENSYLNGVDGNGLLLNGNLYQYAQKLYVSDLEVNNIQPDDVLHNAGVPLLNSAMDLRSSTPGFTLGNVDIVYPSAVWFKDSDEAANKYRTSVDLTNSNCQLAWVKRKISNTEKYVYVLALKNCDVTCSAGEPEYTDQLEDCGNILEGYSGTVKIPVRVTRTCETSESGAGYELSDPVVEYVKSDGSVTSNPQEAMDHWNFDDCWRYQWVETDSTSYHGNHWHRIDGVWGHGAASGRAVLCDLRGIPLPSSNSAGCNSLPCDHDHLGSTNWYYSGPFVHNYIGYGSGWWAFHQQYHAECTLTHCKCRMVDAYGDPIDN